MNIRRDVIGRICGAIFKNLAGFECKRRKNNRVIMLGTGEPCARKLNMTCNESTTNEEKRNHASLSLVWISNLISAKRRRWERQMKGLFDFATWRIYEPVGPMPIFCRLLSIDTKEKTRTLIPQKWTQWQFRPIPLNQYSNFSLKGEESRFWLSVAMWGSSTLYTGSVSCSNWWTLLYMWAG